MGAGSPHSSKQFIMNGLQEKVKWLLTRQVDQWDLARKNYEALQQVQTRTFEIDGFQVKVQFNPARVVSTAAATDKASIRQRRCFLCPDHLPEAQLRLPVLQHYQLLCNPYPIFPQHLTVPALEHAPQRILPRIGDLLELATLLPDFTLFYNGPQCGASAPDHAHFQAAPFGLMPIDREVNDFIEPIGEMEGAHFFRLTGYLRNGFVLRASSLEAIRKGFNRLYRHLPMPSDGDEPRMNLFAHRQGEETQLVIIPRKSHRPRQYFPEAGDEQFLTSPGAADIGGLFITVRPQDFERISAPLLCDIYRQVCLSDAEISAIGNRLVEDQQ